jgi:Ammonium Transporter Family
MAELPIKEVINNTFHMFPRNNTHVIPGASSLIKQFFFFNNLQLNFLQGFYDLTDVDASFPLITCLIIFQMQTGFALVEAGIVRKQNGVNIMMKNIADVCIGGLAFYIFGFGLMFGRGEYSTPFFGAGEFFVDTKFGDPLTCQVFTLFLYQMSYATTR